MADINKELLKALNGPAPQHKVSGEEAFEFSEGSDGALHTKIVDHLGNPISNTNKLQVADADLKAELESIKQTQQEILERLDGTFKTQLTGSLVEEGYAINRLEIRDTNNHEMYIDLSKYSKVYFSCTTTLDVDPVVEFRIKRATPNDFAGTQKHLVDGQWVNTEFKPTRWNTYHVNEALPFLNNLIAKEIMIRVSCATVPTTGSLSILFWGVA